MWQQFYTAQRDKGFEILSVAADVQGPGPVRRFTEAAGVTHPVVVDDTNQLGAVFGYKAIPNGILLDEESRVVHTHFGGYSIQDEKCRDELERWLQGEQVFAAQAVQAAPAGAENGVADLPDVMRRAGALIEQGQTDAALEILEAALAADPDNWLIRKQIWAVRHPEKFYPAIDFGWQKEQLK